MHVEIIKLTSWENVKEAALATIGKKYAGAEITASWKKKILLAEHSPIRALLFEINLYNVPYFVSTHFVRHSVGITHLVTTQRSDRTGIERSELPQGALVNHKMIINSQAIITISRKRLCSMADKETVKVWKKVKAKMSDIEKELAECMVKECSYRGFCPEFVSCMACNNNADEIEILKNTKY